MKVILNEDVKHLGELGDVKNVADGYARNYLFPHGYALPATEGNLAIFEARKAEIEARKEQKRKDSASLKEKLEALEIELTMPAGANGKRFGAVTNQTIADYYAKNGFEIERKKIEISGLTIKQTGNYKITVHLYESATAEVKLAVKPQETAEAKKETKKAEKKAEVKEEAPAEEAKAE